jgi:hypothetical protein
MKLSLFPSPTNCRIRNNGKWLKFEPGKRKYLEKFQNVAETVNIR